METCILQNTSLNIYEEYFTENDEHTNSEEPGSKTACIFRDPCGDNYRNFLKQKLKISMYLSIACSRRPVSSISWGLEGTSIAVTYCNQEFQSLEYGTPKYSYIFDLQDPTKPLVQLEPPDHLVSLEPNIYKDWNLLAGGCYNGQVIMWPHI